MCVCVCVCVCVCFMLSSIKYCIELDLDILDKIVNVATESLFERGIRLSGLAETGGL